MVGESTIESGGQRVECYEIEAEYVAPENTAPRSCIAATSVNPDSVRRVSSRSNACCWCPMSSAAVAAWPCDVVLNGITGSTGLAPDLLDLRARRVP